MSVCLWWGRFSQPKHNNKKKKKKWRERAFPSTAWYCGTCWTFKVNIWWHFNQGREVLSCDNTQHTPNLCQFLALMISIGKVEFLFHSRVCVCGVWFGCEWNVNCLFPFSDKREKIRAEPNPGKEAIKNDSNWVLRGAAVLECGQNYTSIKIYWTRFNRMMWASERSGDGKLRKFCSGRRAEKTLVRFSLNDMDRFGNWNKNLFDTLVDICLDCNFEDEDLEEGKYLMKSLTSIGVDLDLTTHHSFKLNWTLLVKIVVIASHQNATSSNPFINMFTIFEQLLLDPCTSRALLGGKNLFPRTSRHKFRRPGMICFQLCAPGRSFIRRLGQKYLIPLAHSPSKPQDGTADVTKERPSERTTYLECHRVWGLLLSYVCRATK